MAMKSKKMRMTIAAFSVATLAGAGAVTTLPQAVSKTLGNDGTIQLAQAKGCNPCAAKKASNPCAGKNPCAAKNPCAGKNPCAAKKK